MEEIKPTSEPESNLSLSVMGIASLIIGIIALLLSAIPIVNNASFFLALLGIIFWIIGAVGVFKGKKRNKLIIILAIIFNVLAIVVCLCTQSFYGSAWDSAFNQTATAPQSGQNNGKTADVKVGETVEISNGINVTVVSVSDGLVNYDGSAISKVTVKYENSSDKELSFNSLDWKVEDAQGARTDITLYTPKGSYSSPETLNSGKLAPGGSKTGDLYFKTGFIKVCYSSNLFTNTIATWSL